MPRRSEDELVQQAKKGDDAAFAELWDKYHQKIFSFIYSRVDHSQEAEELAAEVFERAWGALPSFRRGNFKGWLFEIARNLLVDQYRRRARRVKEIPLREEILRGIAEEMPDRKIQDCLRIQALQEAYTQLTDEQQWVIHYKFVEQLSNAEIAEILGKNEGAVKSMQHRALDALSRLLGGSRT